MRSAFKALLTLSAFWILAATVSLPAGASATCNANTCASTAASCGVGTISTLIPTSEFPPNPTEGNSPIVFVDPHDGRGHRFVVTQQGKIYVWNGWRIRPIPFLDLSAKVLYGGERGLLAMGVAPDYATSGRFYVFYTADVPASPGGADGDLVIERYQRSASDPETADPATASTVLVLNHPIGNHNGGWLAFGPNDGYLYVSTGDGGSGCDLAGPGNGQNVNRLLGKILRLDVSGADLTPEVDCGNDYFATTGYDTPSDNPFVGGAGCDEVWALGLRNPFRFSFDRNTGDLFLGDVGQRNWEEINFIAASATPPLNFGWVTREGCETSALAPSSCANGGAASAGCQYPTAGGLYDPILCHSNNAAAGGWVAIMGGYRYRGSAVPSLAGRYLYSDVACGQIWRTTSFDPGNPLATESECWDAGNGGIFAFGEDHLGELYLVNGFGIRVDCIHNGAGCPWASEPLVFGDDFETGDDGRWTFSKP